MRAAPNSLAGLLEQHAEAALHISRADQTAWNGHIVEAGDGILGLAHWDGTLHLDRECILDPLQEMYSRAGQQQPTQTLTQYREALVTLLHEQSHFLSPTGSSQEAARYAFTLPGGRHLEEGIAEAWAHDHLNEYIRHLGIDKVAPGITKIYTEPSYAAYVPAVRLLASDLDRRAGLPPGDALQQLNRQTAEGQWNKVVDLIYTSSRLPQLVPPDLAPTIRHHLDSALRSSFQALEPYEPFPRGFASARSHTAGARILTLLREELSTAEKHYGSHPTSTVHHTPRSDRLTPVPGPSPHQLAPTPPSQALASTPSSQALTSTPTSQAPAPSPSSEALIPSSQARAQLPIQHALSGVAPPTHQAAAPSPTPARPTPRATTPTSELSL
jgi:hypothetical protein